MNPVRLALLALAVALCGCGSLSGKGEEIPEATLPTWVGRIVMVDAVHRFALVETVGPARLEPGARLLAFAEAGRTAVLELTAENRPPHLAADITGGMPALGDRVALDESLPPEAMPAD
jgi:hypothetical protein